MEKIIMIKYGELTTKKDNRNFFIRTLENNIINSIKEYNPKIRKDYFRMFIIINEEYLNIVIEKLKNIFGIYEIVECYYEKDKSFETICELCTKIIKSNNSFKVITNRSDKNYPIKSMDLSKQVGGYLLKNIKNLTVDVHNPNIEVNIEIRKEGVYVYSAGIKGSGGYPTGTLGKALLMLSGGIDSVVAGYLTMKRGVKIDFIYFESLPHTSLEAREKVISLAKILKEYGNTGKLYIIPFTKIQETIYKDMSSEYMITMMRRMMYRIAEKVAKKYKSNVIINGESIGQVASQTLTSINVVNEVTNYPIIRPLSSFDKLEIIEIAKKIGSYEISILPYEDCCTIFVPTHPVINPNLEFAKKQEENFDFALLDEAVNNILILDLKNEVEQNDYL